MDPVVLPGFVTPDEADLMVSFLYPISKPNPRPNSFIALGWPNSFEASQVGETRPLAEHTGDEKVDAAIDLIGDTFHRIKVSMEEHFGVEMGLVQGFYQRLTAGGSMELHSDTTDLDGSPLSEDGTPEENEWSAVLYLSEPDVDFVGGDIEFPKQSLVLKPHKGMLVYFKGDHLHPHEVKKITSGERSTIVFFYGPKGRNSKRIFYDH